MIADQRAKQERRPIHLIYAVNYQNEFVFLDELKKGTEKVDLIATNHEPTWTSLSGSLSADRVLELHPPKENSLYYLSGPEPMVEAITKDLWVKGIPKHQIVTDYFPGYSSF
jgi:ferredoxin-NADP reductase